MGLGVIQEPCRTRVQGRSQLSEDLDIIEFTHLTFLTLELLHITFSWQSKIKQTLSHQSTKQKILKSVVSLLSTKIKFFMHELAPTSQQSMKQVSFLSHSCSHVTKPQNSITSKVRDRWWQKCGLNSVQCYSRIRDVDNRVLTNRGQIMFCFQYSHFIMAVIQVLQCMCISKNCLAALQNSINGYGTYRLKYLIVLNQLGDFSVRWKIQHGQA